jgi:DNA-binding NtrC family response regulator
MWLPYNLIARLGTFIPSASPHEAERGRDFSALPAILIVEDGPTVRNLLQEILGQAYECLTVKSVEEGLRFLAELPFDLTITDVKLPGMGGEGFLAAAQERAPEMPVIVISGGYGGDESKFIGAGAFGYLLKPFRFAEVEELIVRALGSSSDS